MCCGNNVVAKKASTTTTTWSVLDESGTVVDTKTSEIAAKLAAARIGGTVEKQTKTS